MMMIIVIIIIINNNNNNITIHKSELFVDVLVGFLLYDVVRRVGLRGSHNTHRV